MLEQLVITQKEIIDSLKKIEEREESGFRVDAHRFPKLSDLVGSIRDSVVVGGVAGHGKSQLVQQMAVHGALNENKVLYCDFENPLEELHKTILIKLANIACPEPGSGPTIEDLMRDPEGIIKSIDPHFEIFRGHFFILKPHSFKAEDKDVTFPGLLEEVIPELLEIPGKDTIVVIDSFDELFKASARLNRTMTEIADSWLERLRSIKEKHEITVILICEYTKSEQAHREYAPKWSSSIGHFARLNLFIKRPEEKDHVSLSLASTIENRVLEVVRNQYGTGTGKLELLFDTERLIYTEAKEESKYE